ncbi:MAG: protein jag [Clostridia bacterium]|nr:protein jag [Clostridia bacterium]
MRSVEVVGRTKEEALDLALKELKVARDKVQVEILEEVNNKGLLGLININRVRLRVKVKDREEYVQKAVRLLREILVNMGIYAEVEIFKKPDHLVLNVNGSDLGKLIGRRGQTLNSLQYLVNLAVNKDSKEKEKIIIDVGGYRHRREESLRRLANRAATRVSLHKKKEVLHPMTPYERRIIHLALQNNEEVQTYSEGKDPFRRVVISPKDVEKEDKGSEEKGITGKQTE